MAPSQLKQLKTSLREHGVLGPQKSKKQKQATAKDASKRLQRNAALEGIRERFNPFETNAPARKEKHEVFTASTKKAAVGRPGVTRGFGEERRKETLLRERQRRNKVGGLVDRRFGENDPSMTPEQRAAERFARQNERKLKKSSIFNLEEDSEEEFTLTHAGRSLDLDEEVVEPREDFQEDDLEDEDVVADFEEQDDRPRKRIRMGEGDFPAQPEEDEDIPLRKKTKNEVMQEVIAKSKMYKAERQAAKEDDDELRRELDSGMNEFWEALRVQKIPAKALPSPPTTDTEPAMNPDRAAMLSGKSRVDADKEYQEKLRQLKLDATSQPTTRTKTEEEKAAENASRLQDLERKRLRRMKGEEDTSDEEQEEVAVEDVEDHDDAEEFGLAQPDYEPRTELDVEDEDDFVLDDDLIASDSDADLASDAEEDESNDEAGSEDDDDDDDLMDGVRLPSDSNTGKQDTTAGLAYAFPCPGTHEALLKLTADTPIEELPVLVQRVRTLYHKSLGKDNQHKLDNFAAALIKHLACLTDAESSTPFTVLENLIRHLHSMAKASPLAIGNAFREHLKNISNERPLQLQPGDLIILTAISKIFSTSDQFHSVVTPAMLTITRYLGQSEVQNLQDLGIGVYCCSLALQYQHLSKRYVPEVIKYIVNGISMLAPIPLPETMPIPGTTKHQPLNIHLHQPESSLGIRNASKSLPTKLSFTSIISPTSTTATSLLSTLVHITHHNTTLWSSKSSFPSLANPLIHALTHLSSPPNTTHLPSTLVTLVQTTLTTLHSQLTTSLTTRHPLLLHSHRPLPIKSSYPQFIENYNPDRHYDPDADRAQMSKLKAEHKKERKGAMRELRKDANFMAREGLREKKERDAEYERKYRRLVSEIQGEEGREARVYEGEKERRTKRGRR